MPGPLVVWVWVRFSVRRRAVGGHSIAGIKTREHPGPLVDHDLLFGCDTGACID
jgi:hypothetical protein